jgi:hypothetical protein
MPYVALEPLAVEALELTTLTRAELVDQIGIMCMQEETTYAVDDYMKQTVVLRKFARKPVNEDCRLKMCQWCFHVINYCKFRRETVVVAMSYLDRYLSTEHGRPALLSQKHYQLVAMTALYIAIKISEPMEVDTSLLSDLSQGMYSEMDFVDMEQHILEVLEYRVCGPTALSFVQVFLGLAPVTIHPDVAALIMDSARYQTELLVSSQSLCTVKPSEAAFAAILNAMEGLDESILTLNARIRFIRIIEESTQLFIEDLSDTQAKLSNLVFEVMGPEFIVSSIEKEEELSTLEIMGDYKKRGTVLRQDSPSSVMVSP